MCCASRRCEWTLRRRVAISFGAALLALATWLMASPAWSQCPAVRPTDPALGQHHYSDPSSVVFHDASAQVRVWYASAGPDAPALSAPGTSGAPLNVELVGDVVEQARAAFLAMGFAPALGDGGYKPCASNGGDGRLDVYLLSFPAGADGSAPTDQCNAGQPITCSGFILLDNDFAAGSYTNFAEAVQVVAPHELFHLVQKAYDADLDAWWAEGTAQWAADKLRPSLADLERFLPTYFARPEQPLDLSGGGATNAWLYATAIWPVFLDQRFGTETILQVYQQLGLGKAPALAATDAALDVPLADAFMAFASYNAATGERATSGEGYADAATYPMVPTTALDAVEGVLHQDVLAGLSAHYFVSTTPRQLTLDADPERVAAVAIPLIEGRAVLSMQQALPADLHTDAIVIVAGRSSSKVDAGFRLLGTSLPPEPEPEPPAPSEADAACAVRSAPSHGPAFPYCLLAALAAAATLRRRASSTQEPK